MDMKLLYIFLVITSLIGGKTLQIEHKEFASNKASYFVNEGETKRIYSYRGELISDMMNDTSSLDTIILFLRDDTTYTEYINLVEVEKVD